MKLSIRLNLIFEGYTDDPIGLITYVLNHRFKISESKVRELLETNGQDRITMRGLEMDAVHEVVKRLLELQPPTPLAGEPLRTKPESDEIVYVLMRVMDELGFDDLATSERLYKLGNFIYGNWDELTMMINPPEGEPDTGDIEAELANVPKISMRKPGTADRAFHSRGGLGRLHKF
jgi:hypothetical protein